MRSYRIDGLMPEHCAKLKHTLAAMELGGGIDGLFWLPVPRALLSHKQHEHVQNCGPYAMALEVEEDHIHMEFLVRARNCLHCECVHYAAPELEQHMMRYVDGLLGQHDALI